ncbi:acetolactate synthase large subunit [Burkholderia vietnamiensis]|jgi:acetolactate synthase-1/2/3 large subunit|uniref:Thiamine pyrophosphate enzyme domain protein TPP-binding protein n=3 Tax=Burkholderia TaxID=32008 RepID=A4JLJ6_BURVG|nr:MULTISPECIES: acetolactate synthase large subunit [Burkholderia]ABO57149.1 thiamine pyrophosphate enzyme domain protein TPP-binding protein [Burkholderia vietnamiensis G4]AJY03686.1 thiamine pyrophosphate enzyme, central domain protein [Burkholderia vietnamiensis LMG 10929]AOK42960.1 acetolactate synthase [Burkholderia vietnamiensis]AVR13571.1 acetolactate synthase large subunit [Burkholderia vietnamiensis]KKI38835.1 acetolactate synthase [Burkholderia vietnamiensis]
MKASDLFVKALEAEGVEYVFGIPGEENLDLLESLRRSKIKLVLTRHEQAAGFMAATYGRLTGRTGVCLATLGPGATNFVTAAAYAQLGGMPMLMITGQKPIKSSKQGHFQIVDVVGMMQPLTKFTRQIVSIGNIPSAVREAFRRAEEERPGAAHLELPEDIAHEEGDGKPIPRSFSRRPIAEQKAVAHAVDAIQAARHPLLMIGAGGNRKTTCKMLLEFVDETGIPFFTTQMGKGVIDETHPLWLGNATLSDGDFVHRAIEHADCIINVGHDVIEKPPFFMRTDDKTVIHVNFLGAQVDPVYFPQIEVVGDIANAVWQMKEAIAPQPHWDFERFTMIKAHFEAHLQKGQHDPRFPMYPVRIVNDLYNALPVDGIVCLDNGMYKIWFARYWRAHEPNSLLLDNALASMGAGLPSAIATRIVHPQRKVIAVCGDGGFMMNSQELETAVRLKLDLVVMILRDDAFGMIRWKQENMNFPDFAMTLKNPDFVAYAQSYGAHGHRVEAADDLEPLLRECFATPGVHVIDVPIDYSDNERVLNREIKRLSAQL